MNDFHVFLSYTSREDEVREIQPLIDEYCKGLWEWAQRNGINIFYDHFSMEKKQYSESELYRILSEAVSSSKLMTAFISPNYIVSKWCQFEWLESRKRRPPILHALHWKGDLNLNEISAIAMFDNQLIPEKYTDMRYICSNPTPDQIQRLATKCVEESIRLIEQHYL